MQIFTPGTYNYVVFMTELIDYTDGYLYYIDLGKDSYWLLDAEPNVMDLFGRLFQKSWYIYDDMKFTHRPRCVRDTNLNRKDLNWFKQRFNLIISKKDQQRLNQGEKSYDTKLKVAREKFYKKSPLKLDFVLPLREYQERAANLALHNSFLLVADQVGLGKTPIGMAVGSKHLPCLIVCETHIVTQWKEEIHKFLPQARVCPIYSWAKLKELPDADFYIDAYSRVWRGHDYLMDRGFKSIILDEVQSLRADHTQKYHTVKRIAETCDCKVGLSATPIMNYGNEIFNIFQILAPGMLGNQEDFNREWCKFDIGKARIREPKQLGNFLRKNMMMVRRTRQDVQRELPQIERTVYNVPADMETLRKFEQEAEVLAMKVVTGSFKEAGMASRELDYRLRHATGVSKAHAVAEVVKMILDTEKKVVLFGWHRDVYDVWLEDLKFYRPVLYTGSETPKQKEESRQKFINGDSRVFIMSLRSGSGLNGLQDVCSYVVFGELDWSAGIIDQCIGRLWREGQQDKVTALFVTIEDGADPVMKKVIGKKASEAKKIVEQEKLVTDYIQDSHKISNLAKDWLNKKGYNVDKILDDKEKEKRGEKLINLPSPDTDERKLIDCLQNSVSDVADEDTLQKEVENMLKNYQFKYDREFELSERSRVDFRVNDILVECKAGQFNKKSMLRQIKRYISDYPQSKSIIVVAPDFMHHFKLKDVNVYFVNTSDSSLRMGGLS